MDRRTMLKMLATGTMAGLSGQLFAAQRETPRCLLVFLRGAYDATNLLVPVSSDFYYEVRPSIAIARPSEQTDSALSLTTDWGLHPALRDSIFPLYQRGEALFIPFAGTDDTTRSHFETQDSIEHGLDATASHAERSGFLNRLAQQLQGVPAISFTPEVPVILQGRHEVDNLSVKTSPGQGLDARLEQAVTSLYRGGDLEARVAHGFAVRNNAIDILNRDTDPPADKGKGFAQEARRIALLMKERYALGFVDVGGWDTHVSQGGASGTLARRLEELGQGLARYAETMGPAWKNTVVVVISEFGRTFRENGNHGTDHGHGTVYWVLGGSLQRHGIIGEEQALTEKTLFQNRDYPVLNEYRKILGGLFGRLYGLNARSLAAVFPGVTPTDMGIL